MIPHRVISKNKAKSCDINITKKDLSKSNFILNKVTEAIVEPNFPLIYKRRESFQSKRPFGKNVQNISLDKSIVEKNIAKVQFDT